MRVPPSKHTLHGFSILFCDPRDRETLQGSATRYWTSVPRKKNKTCEMLLQQSVMKWLGDPAAPKGEVAGTGDLPGQVDASPFIS